MSKLGKALIKSAKEAVNSAKGETAPSTDRVHVPGDVDVRAIRLRLNMTQEQFAARFGFAVSALRDWEYKRRNPDRSARVLLKVIENEPEAVDRALTPPASTHGQSSGAPNSIFEDALESLSEGFAIFDRDDRLVFCNDSYRKGDAEVVTEILKVGATYEEILRARLKANVILDAQGRAEEWIKNRLEQHRRGGRHLVRPRERGDQARTTLLSEYKTRDGGTVIVRTDIKEQVRAEDVLRESEERFRAAFENSLVGISLLGRNPDERLVNPALARMLGYTREEMAGIRVRELFHPDEESKTAQLRLAFERGEKAVSVDTERLIHKNGSVVWCETSRTPIFDAHGNLTDVLTVRQDITESKRADVMKSEFIATVSHELRTPLTSIKGALGLIVGGATGALPEKAAKMIEIAYKNSIRLANLVDDILDIEKFESGGLEFDFERLNISDLVADAVRDNQGFADEHGITFVTDNPAPALNVSGDAGRLKQVMANLLSNACKFSPEGGTVEVSVIRHDGMARVSVCDHGPGIANEFSDFIFGRFAQADSSDSRQKEGTGLGLNISRMLVKKHGGLIDFETEPGVGTTFFFDLPVLN